MSWVILVILILVLVQPVLAEGEVLAEGFSRFTRDGGWSTTPDTMNHTRVGFGSAYVGSLLWEDYEVEMTITHREFGSVHAGSRVFVRLVGGWEGYAVTIGQTWTHLHRYDGAWDSSVQLGSATVSLGADETGHLRVKVQGDTIQVYLNGKQIIQGRDPQNQYPYGYAGVRAELARLELANFKVVGRELSDPVLRQRAQANFGPPVEMPSGEMLKASDPASGGARDIMLIYEQAGRMQWQSFDALPYVGYMRTDYSIQDWFFDTFLFLALSAPEGKSFVHGNAAMQAEWTWWLDRVFDRRNGFAGFNRAVTTAGNQIGDDTYKAKVIAMIPYPMEGTTPFGVIDGEEIDFRISSVGRAQSIANRKKAVDWYIQEFLKRWEAMQYDRLELIGFYWVSETLDTNGIDMSYLPHVGESIRDLGYRFYWIPYYRATGYNQWRRAGFDATIMQPNYMFSNHISRSRFETTVADALRYGMGIEIEADERIINQPEARERYLDYLRAGVEYGYDGDVLRGYYQGTNVLGQAAIDSNPEVRYLYDATYQFVKGEFHQRFFDEK